VSRIPVIASAERKNATQKNYIEPLHHQKKDESTKRWRWLRNTKNIRFCVARTQKTK